ncbi:hypothetical protein [Chryseobacterium gambrini]|uniref:hypothetical protein n=1 Tax=Chryseobacterium gambrini TaxID=373672 RepID=UPI0022F1C110|nr:hypothetical protein [Chryseobacterium gambrini]WBV53228.1 hypothetical protein PFY09_02685 [Chryseobacterium gambrini]
MNTLIRRIEENPIIIFFKEYLALIVIVPSIIGGINQILRLVFYDKSLLYFFSASQVLIDSIVSLYTISTSFIFAFFLLKILNNFSYNIRSIIFSIFILITLALLAFTKIYEEYYFIFSIISFGTLISAYFDLQKSNNKYKKEVLFTMIFLSIGLLFTWLHPSENIINFNELTKEIRKKNKNAEIVFVNDKYIIYSLDKHRSNIFKNENRFMVIRQEEIFSNPENDEK